MPDQAPATALGTPYTGEWTPAKLRSEVTTAPNNAFGASSVDTTGKVALDGYRRQAGADRLVEFTDKGSGYEACPPGTPTRLSRAGASSWADPDTAAAVPGHRSLGVRLIDAPFA